MLLVGLTVNPRFQIHRFHKWIGHLLLGIAVTAQSVAESNPLPPGLVLGEPATSLRMSVQGYFEKPLRIESMTNGSMGHWGTCFVADDGTPIVRLNVYTGNDETNFVHELLHLQDTALGIPRRWWQYVNDGNPLLTPELLTDLESTLLDGLLHSKIYPEMRSMGFDPDLQEQEGMWAMIRGGLGKYDSRYPLMPLKLVKTWLQSPHDLELLQALEGWYKANAFDGHLAVGKDIITLIEGADISTPQKLINVYVECVNRLFAGRGKFEVKGWSEENLGSVKRKVVRIAQVSPLIE